MWGDQVGNNVKLNCTADVHLALNRSKIIEINLISMCHIESEAVSDRGGWEENESIALHCIASVYLYKAHILWQENISSIVIETTTNQTIPDPTRPNKFQEQHTATEIVQTREKRARQREIWSASMRWGELSWLKTTQMHCQRVSDRFLEFIFNSCVFAAHGCMHIWCGFVELFRKNVISLSLLMLLTSHRFSELPGERQWEQERLSGGKRRSEWKKVKKFHSQLKSTLNIILTLIVHFIHTHARVKRQRHALWSCLSNSINYSLSLALRVHENHFNLLTAYSSAFQ